MNRSYRKDIDGLRAIAVTLVIAFHTQWTLLRGGFVGVDVFFVISGYLIGSMIIDDVSADRFSILAFYERRVRRIFPALAAVLLATALLAYLYMLPFEMKTFGRSLMAATFSFSNFYFAQQFGYFMPAASTLPLLHTWSLAIEEQFYVFLPLFVLLVHWVWRRGLWLVLLAAALISFGISLRGALQGEATQFYMPQARAWELLLGTLLAWNLLPAMRARIWREGASMLGVALIIASAVSVSSSTPFPGYAALAPCIGAALIIAAGRSGESYVARGLSWSPVVFIGRISYSLYLWHWPIFTFMKLSEHFPADHDKAMTKMFAIGATLIVATLSWKYIETPFRMGPRRPSRKTMFAMAGAAAVVLALVGLGTEMTRGFPQRFSREALAIASGSNSRSQAIDNFRSGSCFLEGPQGVEDLSAGGCLRIDKSRENYLLMGDSYAAHLAYGLSVTFDKINFLQATGGGCTPLLDRKFTPGCNDLMRFLFSDYLLHHKLDRLILTARWLRSDFMQIAQLLDWAASHDIRVILIGPIMRYDDNLPRLLAFSIENKDPGLADAHRIDFGHLDEDLRQLARQKGATYVSLFDILCQGTTCEKFAAPGIPLQVDDGHLSPEGSVLVAERLRAVDAFR
jgi:peptidoglycan/LPS O-acetylase OafA/YrhL